jgi:hypothetical protein
LVRTIPLGADIHKLHSTPKGEVWISYHDQGILGKAGWSCPIGHSGLLRFDQNLRLAFEFNPVSGLDRMIDCYAFNAVGNSDARCYYYTQFAIVHIRND